MSILSHDAIAAAAADLLTDDARGWKLVRMEQLSEEMPIVDGYAPGALYDETESRPGMGDLGPEDEPELTPEQLDELAERDPNLQLYIVYGEGLFGLPDSEYRRAGRREDEVGA